MDLINMILISFGVFFSTLAVIVVYCVWRLARVKKQQKKNNQQHSLKKFPYMRNDLKAPIGTNKTSVTLDSEQRALDYCWKSTLSPPGNQETQSWIFTKEAGFTLEKKEFPNSVGNPQTQQENEKIIADSPSVSSSQMLGTIPKQQSIDVGRPPYDFKPKRRKSNSKQLHISNKMIQDLRQHVGSNKTPRTSRRSSGQTLYGNHELQYGSESIGANAGFDYYGYEDSDTTSIYSTMTSFDGDLQPYDNTQNNTSPLKKRLGVRRCSNVTKSSYRKSGKIIFTTEYDKNRNEFCIHMQQALDLLPRREESDVSSFVKLFLVPGKKQKQQSKLIRGTKEPVYDEMFRFVDLLERDFGQNKVKFKVYVCSLLRKDLIGEASLFLSSLDTSLKETFALDLLLKRSEVSSACILVSLCHQGTFSKLEVIVHTAKKLPNRPGTALLNPYVVVSLYKSDTVETKETVHLLKDRNPTFNESFDFSIHTDHATPLSTHSLVVTVMHKSLVRRDWTIGHVIYSLTSPQESAREQWKLVEVEPHRRHSEWQHLFDPFEV